MFANHLLKKVHSQFNAEVLNDTVYNLCCWKYLFNLFSNTNFENDANIFWGKLINKSYAN